MPRGPISFRLPIVDMDSKVRIIQYARICSSSDGDVLTKVGSLRKAVGLSAVSASAAVLEPRPKYMLDL